MAILKLIDGKEKVVSHNVAAKIKLILEGKEKPESDKQAKFCEQVTDIQFVNLPVAKQSKPRVVREPDQKLHELMDDKNMTGYEKFKAIGKRLKELV